MAKLILEGACYSKDENLQEPTVWPIVAADLKRMLSAPVSPRRMVRLIYDSQKAIVILLSVRKEDKRIG